ncbi:MAG: hypothetical protein VZQ61_00350 [Christensenellaceae bacterium]
MKKALSYKIVLLFIACALCFALAFSFLTVKTAGAADVTQDNINNYFSGAESFNLDGTNLVANVKKDGKHRVSITNALIVDDLAIELNVPAAVSEFKITLTYDSYFVNGAENTDTHEFDKEIKNEFTFAQTGDLTVEITTADNDLSVKVGTDDKTNVGIYYKIKGADKRAAKIAFDFTLTDDADITFKSINQKKSDGTDYKQTFVLDGDNKIATFAKSRAIINDLPMINEAAGLKVIYGKQYKLSFTTYSVFGDVSASDVYVKSESAGVSVDPYSTKPKSVIFNNAADATLKLCAGDDELENYSVQAAVGRDTDAAAPKYINHAANTEVYNQYKTLVENAAKKEYTVDDTTEEHSIRLGDTYKIPSLKNLVTDDFNVYSDLTYTVYYRTPSNASGSASSLEFTVSEAGKYEFYVAFKDQNGNVMDKDDFYKVNPDDENAIIKGTYYEYAVFTFEIKDDAPISVEVPATQGAGYVNTKYVASGFEILSGSNVKYTLYYNAATDAKANSDGWVEVNTDNGFTESEIESIAYDGKYTFTPVKVGAYKIKCEVSSGTSSSARYAEGETVISVAEEPSVVKPDNHWFRNNVWSIVFLSVGTLSLIGIIILLFIKPKEEVETDETGEALNVNAKK